MRVRWRPAAMGVEERVRDSIRRFRKLRYPESEKGFLRLDANTNMLGPNPAAERVLARIRELELNQYPSPFSSELRETLAVVHRVPRDCVIVGNGSDEILDFITKAFLNPGDRVALATPSFVMQRFYAKVNLGEVVEVPLEPPEFGLDVDRILRADAKLTILASPNNPTANRFGDEALEAVVRGSEGLVVIDEAYAEYCGQDFVSRAVMEEKLIVVRTFSKAYGLAGIRVGYAVGNAETIGWLYAAKPPFTVGTLAEQIALEALRDRSFVSRSVEMVRSERERLARAFRELGWRPCRSDANFMLVDVRRPSAPLREALRKEGILVRDMSDFPGLENYVRITIGRPEHNTLLLEKLKGRS